MSFPSENNQIGNTHDLAGRTWEWDGDKWVLQGGGDSASSNVITEDVGLTDEMDEVMYSYKKITGLDLTGYELSNQRDVNISFAEMMGLLNPLIVSEEEPKDPSIGDLWVEVIHDGYSNQIYILNVYDGNVWIALNDGLGRGELSSDLPIVTTHEDNKFHLEFDISALDKLV